MQVRARCSLIALGRLPRTSAGGHGDPAAICSRCSPGRGLRARAGCGPPVRGTVEAQRRCPRESRRQRSASASDRGDLPPPVPRREDGSRPSSGRGIPPLRHRDPRSPRAAEPGSASGGAVTRTPPRPGQPRPGAARGGGAGAAICRAALPPAPRPPPGDPLRGAEGTRCVTRSARRRGRRRAAGEARRWPRPEVSGGGGGGWGRGAQRGGARPRGRRRGRGGIRVTSAGRRRLAEGSGGRLRAR